MTGCNRGQDGVRIVFFYRKYEQNLFTKKKKKKGNFGEEENEPCI